VGVGVRVSEFLLGDTHDVNKKIWRGGRGCDHDVPMRAAGRRWQRPRLGISPMEVRSSHGLGRRLLGRRLLDGGGRRGLSRRVGKLGAAK